MRSEGRQSWGEKRESGRTEGGGELAQERLAVLGLVEAVDEAHEHLR